MNIKEILKPTSIDHHYDPILVKLVKESNPLPHFLFWGEAGSGKTEFAHLIGHRLLGHSFGLNFFEFNSSDERGIDFIREKIKEIALNRSMNMLPNVILLDEADQLTFDAQASLRRIMEVGHAIFILTANYPHKIIQALHSRCSVHEFKGPDWNHIKNRCDSISSFLTEGFDIKILEEACKNSSRSYRDIFKNYDLLISGQKTDSNSSSLLSMKPKEFIDFSWTADPSVILRTLHKEILNVKHEGKGKALVELAEIDYRCSLNTIKALQIQVGFLKIHRILNENKT